jgi:hypothetical protein
MLNVAMLIVAMLIVTMLIVTMLIVAMLIFPMLIVIMLNVIAPPKAVKANGWGDRWHFPPKILANVDSPLSHNIERLFAFFVLPPIG